MNISGSLWQSFSDAGFEGSSSHSWKWFVLVNTESRYVPCFLSFLLPSRSNIFLKMVLVLRLLDLQSGSPTTWCDHKYAYFFIWLFSFTSISETLHTLACLKTRHRFTELGYGPKAIASCWRWSLLSVLYAYLHKGQSYRVIYAAKHHELSTV